MAPGRVEGVAISDVTVDGDDATARIAALVRTLRPWPGARVVLLDGIAFGGFNLVDLPALARALGRPVVAVTPRAPDRAAIRSALRTYFPNDYRRRWARVSRARPRRALGPYGPIWAAASGLPRTLVPALLARVVAQGHWPESLTVAHRIATAVARAGRGRPRANHYPPGRRRPSGPVA